MWGSGSSSRKSAADSPEPGAAAGSRSLDDTDQPADEPADPSSHDETDEPAQSWPVSESEFEELVDRAMARIPAELLDLVDNCVLTIADEPPPGSPGLLGLYEGIALTRRDFYHGAVPDVITLYRGPLTRYSGGREQLEHQVYVTVVHEIGHHFGLDDERLHELKWG